MLDIVMILGIFAILICIVVMCKNAQQYNERIDEKEKEIASLTKDKELLASDKELLASELEEERFERRKLKVELRENNPILLREKLEESYRDREHCRNENHRLEKQSLIDENTISDLRENLHKAEEKYNQLETDYNILWQKTAEETTLFRKKVTDSISTGKEG